MVTCFLLVSVTDRCSIIVVVAEIYHADVFFASISN